MPIHDYNLENQNGANFRADLNNNLEAIVSNNSNPTEPTITYAHMWWADTTNDLLKMRNATNDGWVDILVMSTGTPVSGGGNTASLTTPGWFKDESTGLITQWDGVISVKVDNPLSSQSFPFPDPFPTACLNFTYAQTYLNGGDSQGCSTSTLPFDGYDANGFSFYNTHTTACRLNFISYQAIGY